MFQFQNREKFQTEKIRENSNEKWKFLTFKLNACKKRSLIFKVFSQTSFICDILKKCKEFITIIEAKFFKINYAKNCHQFTNILLKIVFKLL